MQNRLFPNSGAYTRSCIRERYYNFFLLFRLFVNSSILLFITTTNYLYVTFQSYKTLVSTGSAMAKIKSRTWRSCSSATSSLYIQVKKYKKKKILLAPRGAYNRREMYRNKNKEIQVRNKQIWNILSNLPQVHTTVIVLQNWRRINYVYFLNILRIFSQ